MFVLAVDVERDRGLAGKVAHGAPQNVAILVIRCGLLILGYKDDLAGLGDELLNYFWGCTLTSGLGGFSVVYSINK